MLSCTTSECFWLTIAYIPNQEQNGNVLLRKNVLVVFELQHLALASCVAFILSFTSFQLLQE
uniref:Uncharacterized protein n=1 Tax=Anguilla anguilla TaxID=7936 RepID=A0A0E9Q636_ANGAN